MKLHILVKLNQNERIWICLPESAHFGRICPIPPLYNKISITKGGGSSYNHNEQTQKKVIEEKVSNRRFSLRLLKPYSQ
jgi:hypothetical protein